MEDWSYALDQDTSIAQYIDGTAIQRHKAFSAED